MKKILNNKKVMVVASILFVLIISLTMYNTLIINKTINLESLKDNDSIVNTMAKSASEVEGTNIKVEVGGELITASTIMPTVGESLKSLGIEIDEDDKVTPALEDFITPDMEIKIVIVEHKEIIETEEIPYSIVNTYNNELEVGQSRIKQNGQTGTKEVKKMVTYEDGTEVSEEFISETIIKKPVHKIVEKGKNDIFVSSRGETFRFKKALDMEATAYDLSITSCGKSMDHPQYGITASGFSLKDKSREQAMSIAVNRNIIPLGSKVYVKISGKYSYMSGVYRAVDTGGFAYKHPYRIDIFMGDFKMNGEADITKAFGLRKNIKVYILK